MVMTDVLAKYDVTDFAATVLIEVLLSEVFCEFSVLGFWCSSHGSISADRGC